jgi:hypothetical protein
MRNVRKGIYELFATIQIYRRLDVANPLTGSLVTEKRHLRQIR